MPPITYPDLILAVTLSSRGFAFVRFEGPLAPFDWGISENKGRWMNASQLKRIQSIIERYHPTTLVIENLSAKRSPQVRARSLGLRHMAVASEMNACLYDRAAIRLCFASVGARTKYEIAQAIAREYQRSVIGCHRCGRFGRPRTRANRYLTQPRWASHISEVKRLKLCVADR